MRKDFEIKEYKEIDDETIQILASDETVDRDNDIILANSWDVSGWLKSGSILYGHNPSGLPVGSAAGAEIRDNKLYVYSKFAKKGTSEWHDAIRSLVEQKILRGVSVGFKSGEFEPNEFGGRTFTRCELLEVSLTPVPANPNAMALTKEYSDEVKDSLFNEEEEVEVEQDTLEEAQVAEPEPEDPVDTKTERFLSVYNKLKTIIGDY